MAGEKILSIDDSPTVQRLIDMILSSQGFQVILASDGEEGIAKAKAEKPAVILVDFVMPKMNGFQVCKTLKEDPDFQDTPIILVTSKGDKVGTKFVDVLGIAEYFTKPFQPDELIAKIREVIGKQGGAAAPAPAPAAPPRAAAPQAAAPAPRPAPAPAGAPAAGIESVVREAVERALEEFARNTLPEIVRREIAKTLPANNAGIKGNLASFRIIELLQMLSLQRQTGRLAITRGSDGGEICFKDGEVVFASTSCGNGRSSLDGLLRTSCKLKDDQLARVLTMAEKTKEPIDTVLVREKLIDSKSFADCLRTHTEREVYKIMSWREGSFFFEKAAPPAFASALRLKVEDLLLEGARRADEWVLIQQKIPNFTVVFEPLIGNAEELTRRGLSEMDVKIFTLVDGKRTIQDILDASCLGEFEVAKSLFILLSVNLIRRAK